MLNFFSRSPTNAPPVPPTAPTASNSTPPNSGPTLPIQPSTTASTAITPPTINPPVPASSSSSHSHNRTGTSSLGYSHGTPGGYDARDVSGFLGSASPASPIPMMSSSNNNGIQPKRLFMDEGPDSLAPDGVMFDPSSASPSTPTYTPPAASIPPAMPTPVAPSKSNTNNSGGGGGSFFPFFRRSAPAPVIPQQQPQPQVQPQTQTQPPQPSATTTTSAAGLGLLSDSKHTKPKIMKGSGGNQGVGSVPQANISPADVSSPLTPWGGYSSTRSATTDNDSASNSSSPPICSPTVLHPFPSGSRSEAIQFRGHGHTDFVGGGGTGVVMMSRSNGGGAHAGAGCGVVGPAGASGGTTCSGLAESLMSPPANTSGTLATASNLGESPCPYTNRYIVAVVTPEKPHHNPFASPIHGMRPSSFTRGGGLAASIGHMGDPQNTDPSHSTPFSSTSAMLNASHLHPHRTTPSRTSALADSIIPSLHSLQSIPFLNPNPGLNTIHLNPGPSASTVVAPSMVLATPSDSDPTTPHGDNPSSARSTSFPMPNSTAGGSLSGYQSASSCSSSQGGAHPRRAHRHQSSSSSSNPSHHQRPHRQHPHRTVVQASASTSTSTSLPNPTTQNNQTPPSTQDNPLNLSAGSIFPQTLSFPSPTDSSPSASSSSSSSGNGGVFATAPHSNHLPTVPTVPTVPSLPTANASLNASQSQTTEDLGLSRLTISDGVNSTNGDVKIVQELRPDMIPELFTNTRYGTEYEELGIVGQGSFGRVSKVRHKLDQQIYAVKMHKRRICGPRDEENQLQEVYALAMLGRSSPHIVRYYESWIEYTESGSFLCYRLEFCNGGSVWEVWNNNGAPQAWTEDEMKSLLKQMGLALHHLHTHGVAHLDVKPANICICCPEPPGAPIGSKAGWIYKLGDLGLARKLDETGAQHVGHNSDEGDNRYLDPNLLTGPTNAAHIAAADLFSLGACIYELCGTTPLPSNGPAWHAIRNGQLPSLARSSDLFQDLVKSLLCADPARRPTTFELLLHPAIESAPPTYDSCQVTGLSVYHNQIYLLYAQIEQAHRRWQQQQQEQQQHHHQAQQLHTPPSGPSLVSTHHPHHHQSSTNPPPSPQGNIGREPLIGLI